MMKTIDRLSYGNKLRAVSPMWKCGFAALLLLIAYVAHPWIQLLIFLWMLIWLIGYAAIPAKQVALMLGASCLFFIGSLPALIIEVRNMDFGHEMAHGIVLFSLSHRTIYMNLTSLMSAGQLLIRIMACVSASFFVILTTPMSELFQVMKALRVPTLVLEIMMITYRFLFLLSDTAHDMYTAQQSRGGQSGFAGKIRDTATLIARLFVKTMQRYQGLTNGLISRGFTDELQLPPYVKKAVPERYKVEACMGVAVLVVLECWIRWG